MKTIEVDLNGNVRERKMTDKEIASLPVAPIVNHTDLITKAIERILDQEAKSLGYDDIKTAISYRGDPNKKFAAEAEALFSYRSNVWTILEEYLNKLNKGKKELPSVDQVVSLLPSLVIEYSHE